MTGGAGLERFYLPFMDHLPALQLLLPRIFFRVIAPLPIQVRDLVGRTHLGRWITVAIQAKCHAERLKMINLFHLIHLPMALHAANTAIYVNRMIEIHKIGHSMDLYPRTGL